MTRLLLKLTLAVVSTAVFFVGAEFAYRWLAFEEVDARNIHRRYRVFYMNAEREETNLGEAAAKGLVLRVKDAPRPSWVWAPNSMFYLCYTGARQDYFDEHGCVPCRFNSRMVRDREELCEKKPPGQRRIVCLGDSFTFGWGVRVEDAWPRLCEDILRKTDDGIRTVNCGASGTMYVDEYQQSLEHRFWEFEPDAALVTLCLNDLIPSNTALSHLEGIPWYLEKSRILRDLFQSYALQAKLRIDPERDLVGELLDLPDAFYPAWVHKDAQLGRAALWPGGGPQKALLAMRDWCRARKIPFGVAIWPYFQGLGPREHYPFEKIHRLVGEFCEQNDIPFLDLLPALAGHDTPSLWVSPADYHGNREAQRLAAEPIAQFLARLLEL